MFTVSQIQAYFENGQLAEQLKLRVVCPAQWRYLKLKDLIKGL